MTASHTERERFGSVRELIQAQLVEHGLPSLAVAVARGGTILWEEGFGWADRENRRRATEHTLYSLASITKPMTATGLMILAERGLLELDRPINDYLGAASLTARVGDAAGATVRRVANHTSGLPLHYHFFFEDEPYRRPPMAETIRRYGNLVTVPGERYQYSNLGYGLLDYLIARLSGRAYGDFMRQEVFLPLGMTRASIDVGPGLEPFQAVRYGREGLPVPFYDFDHPGGSAAFCSAHDLVRFGMFHLQEHLPEQKAILSAESLAEMQRPTASISDPSGYGIGWAINEDDMGYRSVSHAGGMTGVSTLLALIPSERIAVVALANASCDLPGRVVREVLAVLLPEYAANRAEREARREQGKEAEQAAESGFQPPPELLGAWRGRVHTYEGEMPLTLCFQESGDVHARLGGGLKTLLNDIRFQEGQLTGEMLGEIETEDARRRRHNLRLELRLRGRVLNGTLVTVARPGSRGGVGLSHWTELEKEEEEEDRG